MTGPDELDAAIFECERFYAVQVAKVRKLQDSMEADIERWRRKDRWLLAGMLLALGLNWYVAISMVVEHFADDTRVEAIDRMMLPLELQP